MGDVRCVTLGHVGISVLAALVKHWWNMVVLRWRPVPQPLPPRLDSGDLFLRAPGT